MEISSFVAVPLAGMTLAALGADVVRIDPIGGGADAGRWPLTATGESIYWTGLNRGKRSMALDTREAADRELVTRLIVAAGVLITNVTGRQWHSYEALSDRRSDLIHLEVAGRGDGGTAVDYTVNAATGFPLLTGPENFLGPINHVLPAWDVSCGLYAVLAVLAALRRRDVTGRGGAIRLPLDDVALATAANLGFLTEALVNGGSRPRLGNAVYGQYGQDFVSSDGHWFMVVALTPRHFADLTATTGTAAAVAAVGAALGADFSGEGARFEHRDVLGALFAAWFRGHTAEEICAALQGTSVLWERYLDFADVAASDRVQRNPLFMPLDQPRIGTYLAPGLPISVDGTHPRVAAAPALGQDNIAVVSDWLGE